MTDSVDLDDTRMPLTSADVLGERVERLRELIPEAFVEGKVDFERLKAALGEFVDEGRERYGLSWAGKADAIRNIQSPSIGTLVPCPEESINFGSTENLFIEGDNLEVLKLLQKSYYGKVKMIYIDPPYNTGGEFIYPDNYQEGLEDYLRYSGQKDDAGVPQSTLKETSGRFHSKWLDMMYPRLFLGRNLLRPDGIIFVSIDDHEVHNLRLLLDEVFGSENFVGQIVIQSNPRGRQSERFLASVHEYVLAYAKDADLCSLSGSQLTTEQLAEFKHVDTDGKKYRLRGLRHRGNASLREDRPHMFFPIYVDPNTRQVSLTKSTDYSAEVLPRKSTGVDGRWEWGKATVGERLHLLEGVFIEGRQEWDVYQREYLDREDGQERTRKWKTIWNDKAINYQNGKRELQELFGEAPFDFPKPTSLLENLIAGSTSENDVVLDFFAGSCTTAHAMHKVNRQDGACRRFVMIQLPEKLESPKKLDNGVAVATIADIGLERIKRASQHLEEERKGELEFDQGATRDCGISVYRLTSSNFKIWDGEDAPKDADVLARQLKLFADHVMPDRGEQDILYELMLKAGLPLTAKIEEKDVAGQTAYSIADGLLLICLANPITQETLRAMIDLTPQRVVCLDPAFGGNDQLKTNTVLEMKSHNIEFRTV